MLLVRIVVKTTDYVFGTINVIPNPGCKPIYTSHNYVSYQLAKVNLISHKSVNCNFL